jgi:dihydropteroate synthase
MLSWQTSRRTFDLAARGVIMGILNVTPDSFSDGGEHFTLEAALAHARRLAAEGAEILDVGGESTRPGAESVPLEEELRRVLPVIAALAAETGAAISIDTRRAEVAEQAVRAGAEIVNDVSGLHDPAMRAVVARHGVGAIAMHKQGEPRTMQAAPHYEDVVAEVRESFRQSAAACLASGIEMSHLAFDPGIGFGKTAEHNLSLLRSLQDLGIEGRPLVLGVSRKSFLSKVAGTNAVEDRFWPTVALTGFARASGVRIVRVHEVRPNAQAMRMMEAMLTP